MAVDIQNEVHEVTSEEQIILIVIFFIISIMIIGFGKFWYNHTTNTDLDIITRV